MKALADEKHITPTPIQVQAIPALLAGRDVIGCAQTGTGKTAAFALPVLQHLSKTSGRGIRALVLSPTRELAAQIGASFEAYGRYLKIRHTVIFGGVNEKPQIAQLKKGVDLVVATPGRLLDLVNQGFVDLSNVELFVLDEADRMLDMGFIPDIKRVLKIMPAKRQNLLFSATMPAPIVELSKNIVSEPVRVDIEPATTTVEAIDQRVMYVAKNDKIKLLADLLDKYPDGQAIVFTRTKHGANKVFKHLDSEGMAVGVIHGNKSQNARTKTLDEFRDGRCEILIATDIASRGIDVDDITHVYNMDLPNEPEVYVHRIGRTGRAGRSGTSISFCDETEGSFLRDIEKIIGTKLPVDRDHPFHSEEAMTSTLPPEKRGGGGNRPRSGSRSSSGGGRPSSGSFRGGEPRRQR